VRLTRLWTRPLEGAIVVAAVLLVTGSAVFAQSRVGSTFFPKPADGGTRRFSDIAYDANNDAYLVVWGLGQVGARFVSAAGAPLGAPTTLNSTTGGAARVACGPSNDSCLVVWIQEPASIIGRFVRYNGGAVQSVTAPFAISQAGSKLSAAAPGITYSSAANEFLVAWTEINGSPNVKAQRVSETGSLRGSVISVAASTLWEGFPSLAYNLAQDEYLVVYYFESSGGTNSVGAQRLKPGTGALIGGRSTLYASTFDQYPEVAYNRRQNEYLAITWGSSGSGWMLKGRLVDGNGQPLGSGTIPLAVGGGGDGIGLAYNYVTNTYLGVFLSQKNAEIWGVQVKGSGVPGTQIQVTASGTALATQPQAAGSAAAGRWMVVASEGYKRVMGQLVSSATSSTTTPPPPSSSTSSCTTVQPASNWTCVNGNWLPPTTTTNTSSCTTVQPAAGWTCVNGNWLPPTTSTNTSSCTTVKPGSDWTCVNGNWLPPGSGSASATTCTTVKPGTGWTCVNGNWLPPTTSTSTSSCTTVKPGTNWTCVNGNWLPPGY
jgi:hypothetical protein